MIQAAADYQTALTGREQRAFPMDDEVFDTHTSNPPPPPPPTHSPPPPDSAPIPAVALHSAIALERAHRLLAQKKHIVALRARGVQTAIVAVRSVNCVLVSWCS